MNARKNPSHASGEFDIVAEVEFVFVLCCRGIEMEMKLGLESLEMFLVQKPLARCILEGVQVCAMGLNSERH